MYQKYLNLLWWANSKKWVQNIYGFALLFLPFIMFLQYVLSMLFLNLRFLQKHSYRFDNFHCIMRVQKQFKKCFDQIVKNFKKLTRISNLKVQKTPTHIFSRYDSRQNEPPTKINSISKKKMTLDSCFSAHLLICKRLLEIL